MLTAIFFRTKGSNLIFTIQCILLILQDQLRVHNFALSNFNWNELLR